MIYMQIQVICASQLKVNNFRFFFSFSWHSRSCNFQTNKDECEERQCLHREEVTYVGQKVTQTVTVSRQALF